MDTDPLSVEKYFLYKTQGWLNDYYCNHFFKLCNEYLDHFNRVHVLHRKNAMRVWELVLVFSFSFGLVLESHDPVDSCLFLFPVVVFSLLLFHLSSSILCLFCFLLSIKWLIFLFFVFLHSFVHFFTHACSGDIFWLFV